MISISWSNLIISIIIVTLLGCLGIKLIKYMFKVN